MNLSDYSRDAADKGWGPGWPTNRAADMARVTADRSGTAVNVHKRVARLVDLLLDATEARGYLFDQSQTGGFNSRPIAGTNTPSNHSWGLACDLNWRRNPVSHDGKAHTDFPAWLVPMWNKYGFAWGGDYSGSYRDAMHLEFMGTPAEADALTAKAARELAATAPEDELPTPAEVWNAPIKNKDTGLVMTAADRLLDIERTVAKIGPDVQRRVDWLITNRLGGTIDRVVAIAAGQLDDDANDEARAQRILGRLDAMQLELTPEQVDQLAASLNLDAGEVAKAVRVELAGALEPDPADAPLPVV